MPYAASTTLNLFLLLGANKYGLAMLTIYI